MRKYAKILGAFSMRLAAIIRCLMSLDWRAQDSDLCLVYGWG